MLEKIKDLFRKSAPMVQKPRRRRLDLGDAAPSYPIYAIGDVHGCLPLLKDAEERIAADMALYGKQGLTVLLGDFVDRGPNSAGVIAHLAQPSHLGLKRVSLCGNHDDVFSTLVERPHEIMQWISFGGRETLLSYGIDIDQLRDRKQLNAEVLRSLLQEAIPQRDFEWLQNLPVSLRVGHYLFVHAGIRPGLELEAQTDEDMMWIREPFLTTGSGLPLTVVHGHTPAEAPTIGPNRIGIDTFAYSTGVLAVLKLDGSSATIL
jgi:serine/threonine protein phosphatase 1